MRPVEFKNNKRQTLKGFVHEPKKYDTAVVHLHGFPGTMDKSAKRMCEALRKSGILAMRFAFSGTPPSEGKFEDKLMSQEVKDIKYAIDFLAKHYKFKRLILIGSSTGAVDAALYAHKDKRISKLILMSCVSHLDEAVKYDFSQRQIKQFWEKGHITYRKANRFYNNKKLKKAFYDEFFKLDIIKSMKKFRRPTLILHGTKDQMIPQKDPKELLESINKPKKLVFIKGADHSFSSPIHFRKAFRVIKSYL